LQAGSRMTLKHRGGILQVGTAPNLPASGADESSLPTNAGPEVPAAAVHSHTSADDAAVGTLRRSKSAVGKQQQAGALKKSKGVGKKALQGATGGRKITGRKAKALAKQQQQQKRR
jgi:hypothetical protein